MHFTERKGRQGDSLGIHWRCWRQAWTPPLNIRAAKLMTRPPISAITCVSRILPEILTCLVARVGDDVQCSITQPSVITTTTSEEANVQATDELCELPSCDVTVLDDPSPNSHQSSRCFHRLLVVGDNLLMFFIFGPIVIIFWTGVSLRTPLISVSATRIGGWINFVQHIKTLMLILSYLTST